ncbi:unnamed protein product [Calypogeia fissa]
MQCSHSMHLSLVPGDRDALNGASTQSLSLPNGSTCVSRTGSTNGAAIDILDVPVKPYPVTAKKSKRDPRSRFRKETYVHAIPLIVLFCYFCLWIGSTGPGEGGNTFDQ